MCLPDPTKILQGFFLAMAEVLAREELQGDSLWSSLIFEATKFSPSVQERLEAIADAECLLLFAKVRFTPI